MKLFNKIKWALGITLVFVLILATNLVDRQNFLIVKDALETIYADRLIAHDILFDLSAAIHEKEMSHAELSSTELQKRNQIIDARINELVLLFSTTRLTPKEKIVFEQLNGNLTRLKEYETSLSEAAAVEGFKAELTQIKVHLDDLAGIQVQEGQKELFESQRAIGAADLFTQLEIGALIILAVAVQIIVMYPLDQADKKQ